MCVCRVDNVPLGLYTLSAWLRLVTSKTPEMRQCTHRLSDFGSLCALSSGLLPRNWSFMAFRERLNEPLQISVKDRQPKRVSQKKIHFIVSIFRQSTFCHFSCCQNLFSGHFFVLSLGKHLENTQQTTAEIKNCVNAQKKVRIGKKAPSSCEQNKIRCLLENRTFWLHSTELSARSCSEG